MKVTAEDLRELLTGKALTIGECVEKLGVSERSVYRMIEAIPGIEKNSDKKYYIKSEEINTMANLTETKINEVVIDLSEVGDLDATKGFSTGKVELKILDCRIEKDNITLKLEDPKKNIMLEKIDFFEKSGLLKGLLFSLSVDTKEPVKLNKKLFLNKKVMGDISFAECFNLKDYVEKEISRFAAKEYKYFVTSFSPLTTQIFHLKLSEAVEAELNKNIQVLKKYPFLKNKELTGLLHSKNNYKEEVKNLFIQQISNSNRTLSEIQNESDVVSESISFLRDLIPEEARVNLVETILK
jgi:hypothetical protein